MPAFTDPQDPVFWPIRRLITDITNATQAVVTTASNHEYVDGMYIRLYVPSYYGMEWADGLAGYITVLTPTTFSIDIDTTNFAAYAIPAGGADPYARTTEAIPVGGQSKAIRNIL